MVRLSPVNFEKILSRQSHFEEVKPKKKSIPITTVVISDGAYRKSTIGYYYHSVYHIV